jgi:hypothetical protein
LTPAMNGPSSNSALTLPAHSETHPGSRANLTPVWPWLVWTCRPSRFLS